MANRDPWARIWHLLSSDRFLVIWFALLLVAGLAVIWFPQASRSALLEESELQNWLATVRPQLGSPTDTLFTLGFLTVRRAPWLRLALAGLTLGLLLRAFDAIWRQEERADTTGMALSKRISTPVSPATALDAVQQHLNAGIRRHHSQKDGRQRLAISQRWAALGPILLALGALIATSGWLWTEAAGWELTQLRLTTETPLALYPSDLTLHLNRLDVDWRDNKQPAFAEANLAVDAPAWTAEGTVTLDSGWHWRGISYQLEGVGPAVVVSGRDQDGRPLSLQTAAHQPPTETITLILSPEESLRSFAAPDKSIVVQLEAEPGSGEPRIRLRAYQGRAGELVADRNLDTKTAFTLDGASFSFNMQSYAQVSASYAPGTPLLLIGLVMLALGMVSSLLVQPGYVEVTIGAIGAESEITLCAARRRDKRWLVHLAGRLEQIAPESTTPYGE